MQTFGTPTFPTARQREGSYAIILSPEGLLLTVRGRRGYFLPGGGVDEGEAPEETLHRELMEECGLAITGLEWLTEAQQYYVVDGEPIVMHARFWRASADRVLGPGEDDWAWLPPQETRGRFFHACHEAALDLAQAGRGISGHEDSP